MGFETAFIRRFFSTCPIPAGAESAEASFARAIVCGKIKLAATAIREASKVLTM